MVMNKVSANIGAYIAGVLRFRKGFCYKCYTKAVLALVVALALFHFLSATKGVAVENPASFGVMILLILREVFALTVETGTPHAVNLSLLATSGDKWHFGWRDLLAFRTCSMFAVDLALAASGDEERLPHVTADLPSLERATSGGKESSMGSSMGTRMGAAPVPVLPQPSLAARARSVP